MAACSMLTFWILEAKVDAETEMKDNLINWLHLSLQAFVHCLKSISLYILARLQ